MGVYLDAASGISTSLEMFNLWKRALYNGAVKKERDEVWRKYLDLRRHEQEEKGVCDV